jgi:hypothetical protein
MVEPIICPLWVGNEDRFVSRRYIAWDRPCRLCGRKVVVSDAIKRQLESSNETVLVCEQCALVRSSEIEALLTPEPKVDFAGTCPICASLKEQEEALSMALARARDLPESAAIQRKWAHLSKARWAHRFKAHNQEARGKR